MKTDTELEALLRGTLTSRATEVTEPADFVTPTDPRRVRRPWLPILAAAAAVALATAGVLLGVHLAKDHPPTHRPKPAPQRVLKTTCTTALPAGWLTALQHSRVDTGPGSTMVSSVANDGSAIATRSVSGRRATEVVQLRAGAAPHVLYTLQDAHSDIDSAQLAGHRLVITLVNPQLAPKGADVRAMPQMESQIFVFDLQTHQQRVLYTMSSTSRTVSDGAIVYRNKVYWDEHLYNANLDGRGVLKSYDLGSGKIGTAYHGAVGRPKDATQGLVMDVSNGTDDVVVAGAALPGVVDRAMNPDTRHYLFTDGTAYAWLVDDKTFAWWSPGHPAPVYRRLPAGFYTEDGGGGFTVNGRFLTTLTGASTFVLIDAEHGASAVLPANFGGTQRSQMIVEHGSVLYGIGFLGGGNSSRETVLRIDTKDLPPLTC